MLANKINPRNPNGKKGGTAHQQKVSDVAENAKKRGFSIILEFMIELWDGKKRFVDVAALDKEGNVKELHQIGKINKNGSPVIRERRALDDIERVAGIRPQFHAYAAAVLLAGIGFLFVKYFV